MESRELILANVLPADSHPAFVYLASLSKGSIPAQKSALKKIAEIFGTDAVSMNWGALRYAHVQFVRARLQERYDSATANRLLTALRRVMHHAWKLGQMPDDEYRRVSDIEPIRGAKDETELTGRALTQRELRAVLEVCCEDESISGVRDAAIIALGYGLGLRRAEIAKMHLDDFDSTNGLVRVRSGKGNKSRTLPIDDGARDALKDWIKVRGNALGFMFHGINRGGNISSQSIGVKGLDELFEKRCRQARVGDARFHDLRRTMISDLLDENVDLTTVSRLAGHSDPRTTARYDRRKMETRRKAIKTLHVPYFRKGSK